MPLEQTISALFFSIFVEYWKIACHQKIFIV